MHSVGITGGNGFIGSSLASFLTVNPTLRIQCFDGDVLESEDLSNFIKVHNTVVHLAGINQFENSDDLIDVNIIGTLNAIKGCLQHKARLFVAGSINEFGSYGFSKSICESMMIKARVLGLTGAYMVLPDVFGPRCKPFSNSLATSILYNIANGKEYKEHISNPQAELCLMHIHDVCETIETFIKLDQIVFDEEYVHEQPNRIDFFSYGGFKISLNDFIEVAEGKLNYPVKRVDNAIKQTLQWYKDHASQ